MVRAKTLDVIRRAGAAPLSLAALVAIHAFVCNQIRYVPDPVAMKQLFPRVAAADPNVELLSAPRATLQKGGEDCDGKATLFAAMVKSIAHPAQVGFRAITTNDWTPDTYTHVYNFVRLNGKLIPVDATYPGTRFGWEFRQGLKTRTAA